MYECDLKTVGHQNVTRTEKILAKRTYEVFKVVEVQAKKI